MYAKWKNPYYALKDSQGNRIDIDVTSSIGWSLPPSKFITDVTIPYFKSKDVKTVLDFGAGALRHTITLLKEGFQVYAVEFKEAFDRPTAEQRRAEAIDSGFDVKLLYWPEQFLKCRAKFDACILTYVLDTMPYMKERKYAINRIKSKMNSPSYLVFTARQPSSVNSAGEVEDGCYIGSTAPYSFYTNIDATVRNELFKHFRLLNTYSDYGRAYLFGKGRVSF